MKDNDPFKDKKLHRLGLLLYLLPVIGWLGGVWTLAQPQSDREQRQVSRWSIKVTLLWLLVYSSLWLGSTQTSEIMSFRLLYLNGLVTSAYLLVSLGAMLSVWWGKMPRLPVISPIAKEPRSSYNQDQ